MNATTCFASFVFVLCFCSLASAFDYVHDDSIYINSLMSVLSRENSEAESKIGPPSLELLDLVESFIKLKYEIVSMLQRMFNENFHLFRDVFNVIVSKVDQIRGFTLMGIRVIRNIVHFAYYLIEQWKGSKPAVSVDVNVNPGNNPQETYKMGQEEDVYYNYQ